MIDIIITTYNRAPLFAKCWDSFTENTNMAEVAKIIISNDGSTDHTPGLIEAIQGTFKNVCVLPREAERLGLVPRFNMALELCTADIICEFQDDVEFYPGWLDEQLKVIDKADFITGYDAPEHSSFDEVDGYKIKYSAGFIQLMARRSTWNKYFPMEPLFDFPTPAVVDGRPYGSGIDTRIYKRRKNNPASGVKYLVVPGLVHKAHHFNSTWRPDVAGTRQRFAMNKQGGLTAETAPAYWKRRYAREGATAVGYGNRPPEEQQRIIEEKRDFIRPWRNIISRTLDYGCGVGRMACLFDPHNYIGADMTPEFVEIAKQENPKYRFITLTPKYGTPPLEVDYEQFFTANVLQHNCDQVVAGIFRDIAKAKPNGVTFLLYENTHPAHNSPHMRFRTSQEYYLFIAEHFTVLERSEKTHVVHGEQHTLMRFEV